MVDPLLVAALAAAYSPDRCSNLRPKSLRSAAFPVGHCSIRRRQVSLLLVAVSATDKKPKLCVSV